MHPNIEPFEEWVRHLLEAEELDVSIPEDFDKILLTTKPSQRATWYC
jgi:hypothetical protein